MSRSRRIKSLRANRFRVDVLASILLLGAAVEACGTAVPAAVPAFVQGLAESPGIRAPSDAVRLPAPVAAGHLLVGWFGQYDAPGQVRVSDNVNGAWTRSASEHFRNGRGDIALYYLENSKAAPAGLTITLAAGVPTFLPAAVAEFSGVATTSALDHMMVGEGFGTDADSDPTAPAPAGCLVVGMLVTGSEPMVVTPGSSQGVQFTIVAHDASGSVDVAVIAPGHAGPQRAPFRLGAAMDWYAATATFIPGT